MVTNALLKLLRNPFDGDPLRRTGAELLSLALMKAALEGSVPAMREVSDRAEGKAVEFVEVNDQRLSLEETHERIRVLVGKLRDDSTTIQ